MMKFIFTCLLLGLVFFFGVLYGNHKAVNGQSNRIKSIEQLIQSEKTDDNSAAIGNIVHKQESGEEIQSTNAYSEVGSTVSKAITGLFRGSVTAVSSVIEHLMGNSDFSRYR